MNFKNKNSYLLLVLFFFISKGKLLAQQPCITLIKNIEKRAMYFEGQWIQTDSIDLLVKQSGILDKCYLTKNAYNIITKMTDDSLPKIRFAGYVIINYVKDTLGLKLFIFSKAAIDKNIQIRKWVNYYLNDDDLWSRERFKNKILINNLKVLFEKYPTEIEFGTIRIIGKYKCLELKPFLQKLANQIKTNKYDDGFFSSINWISLMALARMGDLLALKKVIAILNSTENAFSLFREISWVYQYIQNKHILNCIIDIALSGKSLERMYPIDRDDKIGPTFLEYTIAPVLRGNISNFPSGEVYAIKDEARRIAFVRDWLKKNRNKIILNRNN